MGGSCFGEYVKIIVVMVVFCKFKGTVEYIVLLGNQLLGGKGRLRSYD